MRSLILLSALAFITATSAFAGDIETFEEAKKISNQTGKPILLEFVRDDCLHCALAESEVDSMQALREALKAVVFISVNMDSDEGENLSNRYPVGKYFPLFILTDADGEVINRWTGYTDAQRFITSLNNSLKNKTTIKEREQEFNKNPNAFAALNLAKYFYDSKQYLKSIEYYRRAGELGRRQYHFQIFRSTAVACEEGQIEYGEALVAADSVMQSGSDGDIIYTAKIITTLARKLGKTETLSEYLKKGLETARQSSNSNFAQNAPIFQADLALYEKKDVAGATMVKKQSLGADWENNPDKFFDYAEWCLHRKINLEEAEQYALTASQMVSPGKSRARVTGILAAICFELGNYNDAVKYIDIALKNDPGNEYNIQNREKYIRALQGK
jgi:thioredoxin-related protein